MCCTSTTSPKVPRASFLTKRSSVIDEPRSGFAQRRHVRHVRGKPQFDGEQKQRILERLIAAEGLEKYLHRRYPGTKRFGLEGGESLIPMMSEAIQRIGGYGAKEVVIGMAHRGRLNVLVNILGNLKLISFWA